MAGRKKTKVLCVGKLFFLYLALESAIEILPWIFEYIQLTWKLCKVYYENAWNKTFIKIINHFKFV